MTLTPRRALMALFGIVLAGLVLVGVLGCLPAPQVMVTPLGTKRYPPSAMDVAVYMTDMPRCPYVEVAAITVTGLNVWGSHPTDLRRTLTARAAALGANGIIRFTQDLSTTSPTVITQHGTAIRFTLTDCTQ